MIHNSTTDPVLIKKISLKIWSLRDEIESRVLKRLEDGTTFDKSDILKLHQDFSLKNNLPPQDNVLNLKPNAELNTDESEMAKAMQATEEVEEKAEEVAASETTNNEIKSDAEVVSIDKNMISVGLDAPHISEEKISKGKTVLSEISMEKMFLFCNKPFTEGQSIVIQFCIPKSFIINADILYCRPFNLKSRIISENNYTHRVLARFTFLKEGERALLREFIKSIEPNLDKIAAKTDGAKDGKETSEFGELDDLGI